MDEYAKTRNDIDYIVDSIRDIYDVKVKTRKGYGNIA